MVVGCSLWGFGDSTLALVHYHSGSAMPKFHPSHIKRYISVRVHRAPKCPSTASQGAKALCIYMTWLGYAVSGGLDPQP